MAEASFRENQSPARAGDDGKSLKNNEEHKTEDHRCLKI
jgi:hypothetical protein